MIRLAIVVEGQTEERFVRQLLTYHLIQYDVLATPKLLGDGSYHGGDVSVERIVDALGRLSGDFDALTTLVDFYGFQRRPTDDAADLERRIDAAYANTQRRRLRSDRVFSYVQRHEFEALLFSDVRAFQRALLASPEAVADLSWARARVATPEDIDDSPDAAPSKRIAHAIPGYRKVVDGARVAAEVGLEAMRRECPRFAAWLTRIELLGSDS